MTTKDLGIVRLVPKGDWSATVNYQYLNIVRYNGASYIATSASIGIAPDSLNGSTYWQLISQDVGNAIQEELSVIETNVQNNANSIQNQGTLIQNNANDIKNLFAITAPTYTEITVAQAYASRVTADGANIFDDQLTPVQEIAGSTVKTTNLFDISKMTAGVGNATTHTDRDITVTDAFAATNNDLKNLIPNLQIGKTYTFCCTEVVSDVELTANRGGTYIYSGSTGVISMFSKESLKKAITIDENLYNNGSLGFWGNPVDAGGGKVTWKDFQVLEGDWTDKEIPEWTPYFAGLKTANINSIVSMGKNLFDISQLEGADSAITVTDRDITVTNQYGTAGKLMNVLFPNLVIGKTYTFVCTLESSIDISGNSNRGSIYLEGTSISLVLGYGTGYKKQAITLTEALYQKRVMLIGTEGAGEYCKWKDLMCLEGDWTDKEVPEWTPYTKSVFQLPETVELGVFDKILPQTGEIIRATGYATSETGFTDEEIATYNNAVVSNDRKSLVYELATATTTPINAPKVYTVWNGGSETIVQGETDNSEFGAMPTITQTYFGKVGE